MALVAVDPASGALVQGGRKIFPLCLSNGPPADRTAPSGRNGLAEVAAAGINMIRTGSAAWGPETAPGLIALERQKLDAAVDTGSSAGCGSATSPTCPPRQAPSQPSDRERLAHRRSSTASRRTRRSPSGRASTSLGTPPAGTRGSVRPGSSAATSA